MHFRQLALLLLLYFFCGSQSFAQDSNVPESMRLMIQRSQESSRYEQMARMQIEAQYRGFLNTLSGTAQHKSEVENAIIAVLSERAELSARVTSGQANTSELTVISDYAYMRTRLIPLLSTEELSLLDSSRGGPSADQLKQQYAEELERVAASLTDADKDLVLDTLIRYLQTGSDDATSLVQFSVDDLVTQQMQSLMQVFNELQSQFSGEKLQEVTNFLNQLQSNLYRNRSMSDLAR